VVAAARVFTVRMADADTDARGLVDRIAADLDRAAPSEAVTFRKMRAGSWGNSSSATSTAFGSRRPGTDPCGWWAAT